MDSLKTAEPREQSNLDGDIQLLEQVRETEITSFKVKISDVAVVDRARKAYNNIPELAVSLETFGQIQAIRVRKPSVDDDPELINGKPWVLVTGGRRMAAAITNNWTELRAENYDELSPWKRLAIELEENIQRSEMHFSEIAENKLKLHELYQSENPGWDLTDTAKLVGESISNLSRDLNLAHAIRANPSLKKAGSKKAANQAVKMSNYMKSREAQLGNALSSATLRSKLVCADMRDFIRTIPDASIDLVGSDLPYGIDYFQYPTSINESGGGLSSYDDSKATTQDLLTDVVPQLLRVTKESGWLVLMMNWENHFFLRELIEKTCLTHFDYQSEDHSECNKAVNLKLEGIKPFKCTYLKVPPVPWIWYRPNSRNNPHYPDLHCQNQYELIMLVNRGKAKIVMMERVGNVLVFDSDYSERIHAMQKPIELWKEIIQRLTLHGEKVLDVCFGSGTTLAAAAVTGRDFLGCELNPGLLEPALGLVSQYYMGDLTTETPTNEPICTVQTDAN